MSEQRLDQRGVRVRIEGAVQGVERLATKPADFAQRVQRAVAAGAAGLPELMALVEETGALLKA